MIPTQGKLPTDGNIGKRLEHALGLNKHYKPFLDKKGQVKGPSKDPRAQGFLYAMIMVIVNGMKSNRIEQSGAISVLNAKEKKVSDINAGYNALNKEISGKKSAGSIADKAFVSELVDKTKILDNETSVTTNSMQVTSSTHIQNTEEAINAAMQNGKELCQLAQIMGRTRA